MIRYLLKIFETVVSNIISDFLKEKFSKHRKESQTKIENIDLNVPNITYKPDTCNLVSVEQDIIPISKRLENVMNQMNINNIDEIDFIYKIANQLGLENGNILTNYIKGAENPPFPFVNHFSLQFGINYNWLISGERNPFSNDEVSESSPLNYIKRIIELVPHSIYFVMNKSIQAEAGIVLKIIENKYIIFPKTYNISSYVGNTGEEQIFNFYQLIKKIDEKHISFKKGRILEEETFNSLFEEKIYPGFLDLLENNHWWDDFLDIEHKYPVATNYESWYGKEFIKAQEIVKRKMSFNTL